MARFFVSWTNGREPYVHLLESQGFEECISVRRLGDGSVSFLMVVYVAIVNMGTEMSSGIASNNAMAE